MRAGILRRRLAAHDLTDRRALAEVRANDDLQLYIEVESGGVIKKELVHKSGRRMPGSTGSTGSSPGEGWSRSKFKERISIYRRVLTGSSTVALPIGTHYFAVGRAGAPLSEVITPLEIRDGLVLEAAISPDSSQRRKALWFIGGGLGVALLAGGAPLVGGIASDSTVLLALGGVFIVTGVLTAGFGVAAYLLTGDEGMLVPVSEP